MLISTVLTLHPTQPITLPANLGRATHAWFLGQVRRHDPAIAQLLHAPNQERPFTVSNLWGRRVAGGELQMQPEQPLYLRLSSYQPELSQLLAERLLPALPQERLALAGASLRIVSASSDPQAHPWAGQTTFAALVQAHTLEDSPPPRLELRFASPTVFKSQGNFMPLPLPRLVFEGLVRRWNAFAPLVLPAEVNRFAEETMVISRYRLRTERVAFGVDGERGAWPGFVGQVRYGFRVRDRYWMGLIHMLAEFALYAGVGQRTTMGLGQVRVRE